MNRCYFVGHVGQDPELRSTASGTPVVKLSIATPAAKKVEEEWIDVPDWHRVTAFGKTAEWLAKSASKGALIGVECSVKPTKWTNKEGVVQHGIDFWVDRVMMCIPKNRPPVGPPVVEADGGGAQEDAIPF